MKNNGNKKMKNLNCIFAYNAGFYLQKVLEKIVNDKNYLFELPLDRDLKAFFMNHENININLSCGECKGCIEYKYFLKIYIHDFYKEIMGIRKENEIIFSRIEKIFDMIPGEEFEKITNIFSIFGHFDKIQDKISAEEFLTIQKTEKSFQSLYSNLCQCYYTHRISYCDDMILGAVNVLNRKRSNVKKIHIDPNKDVIYLDQNVIGEYIGDDSFYRQIKASKSNGCIFVGSPYLIEDAIKMDPIYFKAYCDKLVELTDNLIIQQDKNKISIKHEEIEYSISRVKLFRQFTKYYEEKHVYTLKYNEIIYPEFGKNNKYYQKINNNIKSFLTENTAENNGFSESLERVLAIEGFSFTLDNLRLFHIDSNENKNVDIIGELCRFLDIINYGVESNKKKKIMSGVQDNEHIKCARAVDYFITDDKNLFKRATFIYRILGIRTTISLIKDFQSYMLGKMTLCNHNSIA